MFRLNLWLNVCQYLSVYKLHYECLEKLEFKIKLLGPNVLHLQNTGSFCVSYSLNFTILKQMHTPTCIRTHTHRNKWSQSERKKAILYLKRNPEEEYNIQVDCLEERVKYFPLIWLGVRYQLFNLSNAYLNSYSTYPVSFLCKLKTKCAIKIQSFLISF